MRLDTTEEFQSFCYGFIPGQVPEIILIPLNFPNHWTIVICDSTHGVHFLDSLTLPFASRLENDERLPIVKDFISRLTNIPLNEIEINSYDPNLITQQQDGSSCGYFTCLCRSLAI